MKNLKQNLLPVLIQYSLKYYLDYTTNQLLISMASV